MYVLQEGGGCQGGVPDHPIGIYKVNSDGTTTLVADLGTFYKNHPVTTPDLSDFLPEGNAFSMTAMGGNLYVAEANHEEIDKVDPATGTITRLVDFSQEPWLGPTGITSYNGSIYFGDLAEFPVVPGSAGIFKLNADGTTTKVVGGLSAVTGLAAGPDGSMYATELSAVAGGPKPNTGAVVRVSPNGTITTVATGLNFPTGLALAPTGGLYVSNNSEAAPPGSGQILWVPAQTVMASGLNYPRGLAVGPDGAVYVSYAGSTTYVKPTGPCAASPFTGAATGAGVAKVAGSAVTNAVTDLPAAFSSELGNTGATDVAFIGSQMYVLEEASGCFSDTPNRPGGVYKVNADGTTTLVANLDQYYLTHPVTTPDLSDFSPLGNVFGMTAMNGKLYIAEANHEEIDQVDPATGTITRLLDFSQEPWLGPTGIAAYNGNIYFGDLTEFPAVPGAAGIFRLNADGTVTKVVSGLTAVTGLAIGSDGTMYVTELTTVAGGPVPGTGAVVKISPNHTMTSLASGLNFPTGIDITPDGGLAVSNNSEAAPPGSGQVVYVPTVQANAGNVPQVTQGSSFTVNWTSKTAGNGMVLFGTGPGCTGLVEVATADRGAGTTSHTVTVTGNDLPGTVGDVGIQQGQTYWYETVVAGQTADNNGGTCYSVTIPDP
jgi:sugar lactone lactonase YvrE